MAGDWDVVAQQPTSTGFTPVGGGQPNALMPPRARVITTVPRSAGVGKLTYRDPTDQELQDHPEAYQIGSNGKIITKPSSAAGADLTPDATDLLTARYLASGDLPNTGMGGADIKVKVLNDAAKKIKELGLTGADVAGQSAEFRANSKALSDQLAQRTKIASYEGTVQDSLMLAQQKADKALANTGFRTMNQVANWWSSETNDPDYAALHDAVETVTNEYAKVISNATGGGVTSDAARAHAESMLSTADSPQSFKARAAILQQEMGFRVNSMDRQIAGLSHKVHSALGSFDGQGQGDYAAFVKAYQAKNNSVDGADQAWQEHKRTSPGTPWRQAFPDLKPTQPSTSGNNDPLGLRGGP